MNQNNYLIRKRMGYIEAALLGNLIYIVLVLLFKKIFDMMGNTGNYNIILGTVFFVVISAYLIGFNWFVFRNTTEKKGGYYNKYIACAMLPIFVLTLAACTVITVMPGDGFGTIWSQFAFLVAPMLFWYLPFGLVFHFIGNFLPIIVFFIICFAYIIILQMIGIALGAANRTRLREREEKRAESSKISVEKATQAYSNPNPPRRRKAAPVNEAQAASPKIQPQRKAPVKKKADPKDPFASDGDTTQIIYTESFTAITDEMLAAENIKKRQNLESKMEKAAPVSVAVKNVEKAVEVDLSDEIDVNAVKRAIMESQKAVGAPEKTETPESPFSDQKAETQNISEELESIRQKMTQRERRRRK
ncbi:MAG: hypothetical protein RR614_04840 [Eubacterium sp.]